MYFLWGKFLNKWKPFLCNASLSIWVDSFLGLLIFCIDLQIGLIWFLLLIMTFSFLFLFFRFLFVFLFVFSFSFNFLRVFLCILLWRILFFLFLRFITGIFLYFFLNLFFIGILLFRIRLFQSLLCLLLKCFLSHPCLFEFLGVFKFAQGAEFTVSLFNICVTVVSPLTLSIIWARIKEGVNIDDVFEETPFVHWLNLVLC